MMLASLALAADMVLVGPAVWHPAFPADPAVVDVPVPAFRLDVTPVTEGEMSTFVRTHPEWQRDRVPRVKADAGYLSHWASADTPGSDVDPDRPATRVSWFAARAYCVARGARLPTESEWEVAAAGTDPATLLAWYAQPTPDPLPNVGGAANKWGVRDLHGLVWEWIDDFDSAFVLGDNRQQGAVDAGKFCGGGAVAAADPEDYAAFMRYAFRSSLRASYTTHNLGFRCAS
jgi:sulfatase modifying factor 1